MAHPRVSSSGRRLARARPLLALILAWGCVTPDPKPPPPEPAAEASLDQPLEEVWPKVTGYLSAAGYTFEDTHDGFVAVTAWVAARVPQGEVQWTRKRVWGTPVDAGRTSLHVIAYTAKGLGAACGERGVPKGYKAWALGERLEPTQSAPSARRDTDFEERLSRYARGESQTVPIAPDAHNQCGDASANLPVLAQARVDPPLPAAQEEAGEHVADAGERRLERTVLDSVWDEQGVAQADLPGEHPALDALSAADAAWLSSHINNPSEAADPVELAQSAANGVGMRRSLPLAAALYELGCQRGLHAGSPCTALGLLYMTGNGVVRHPGHAVALFTRGCELGSSSACGNVGTLYASGEAGAVDDGKAQTFFKRACKRGEKQSCEAATSKLKPGQNAAFDALTDADKAAVRKSIEACRPPTAWRCTRWGERFQNGLGVQASAPAAAAFFQQACLLGEPLACAKMGDVLLTGFTPPRQEEAVPFFKKGCLEGQVMPACYDAAALLGDEKPEAQQLNRRACELGFGLACAVLAHQASAKR
jgi:TPR repeat protein